MAEEGARSFAAKFQQAFEFYLIALVFTVLGLAIQTAPPDQCPWATLLEMLGWVSLMVSGVVGIFRLEWVPVAHKISAQVHAYDHSVEQIEAAQARGDATVEVEGYEDLVPIEQALASTKANRVQARTELSEVGDKIKFRYEVHKWGFIAGLVLLLVARAWMKVSASIERLAI